MGITADFLPHVFDLFVQGDTRTPGTEGGLGIGLTLVQHLVSGHDGQVTVESDGTGTGATFKIHLPLDTNLLQGQAPATEFEQPMGTHSSSHVH